MITKTQFFKQLTRFSEDIASIYQKLLEIQKDIDDIGEMYPVIPFESGEYLLFPDDPFTGEPLGPEGQSKIYIGNKPQAARLKIKNRQRYEKLQRDKRNLRFWIDRQYRGLQCT